MAINIQYISTTGRDSNNGLSPSSAKRTFSGAFTGLNPQSTGYYIIFENNALARSTYAGFVSSYGPIGTGQVVPGRFILQVPDGFPAGWLVSGQYFSGLNNYLVKSDSSNNGTIKNLMSSPLSSGGNGWWPYSSGDAAAWIGAPYKPIYLPNSGMGGTYFRVGMPTPLSSGGTGAYSTGASPIPLYYTGGILDQTFSGISTDLNTSSLWKFNSGSGDLSFTGGFSGKYFTSGKLNTGFFGTGTDGACYSRGIRSSGIMCSGTPIYVRTNGDDNNGDGTIGNPLATAQAAFELAYTGYGGTGGYYILDFGSGNFGSIAVYSESNWGGGQSTREWPSRIAVRGAGSGVSFIGGISTSAISAGKIADINIISDNSVNLGDIISAPFDCYYNICPMGDIKLTDCVAGNINNSANIAGCGFIYTAINGGNVVIVGGSCGNIDVSAQNSSNKCLPRPSIGTVTFLPDSNGNIPIHGTITANQSNICEYGCDNCGNCGPTYGCLDNNACNSSYCANVDDGSCTYNCNDIHARNYHYNCDNCWYVDCNDSSACNYDSNSFGQSECTYGCNNPSARNYHSDCDACWYVDCNNHSACNYDAHSFGISECDSPDQCGVCGGTGVAGCTNGSACNYDSGAACDDGSCYWGCNDFNARNYHDYCNYCWYVDCNDSSAINYDGSSFGNSECIYRDCAGNIYYNGGSFFVDSNGTSCNYLSVTRDSVTCCGDGTYSCGWDINGPLFFDDCWNCGYGNMYDNAGNYNGCCHGIAGCTDGNYCEYNPSATCDNGSCSTYSYSDDCGNYCGDQFCNSSAPSGCGGCYNCIYYGCTNIHDNNYQPSATCDDGSCESYYDDCGVLNGNCFANGNCNGGVCGCSNDYRCGCNSDGTPIIPDDDCHDCSNTYTGGYDDCGNCYGNCGAGYCVGGICGCSNDYNCGCNSDGSSIVVDTCYNCGGTCSASCYNGICGCTDDYGCGCNSDGSSIPLDACGQCTACKGNACDCGCLDYDCTGECYGYVNYLDPNGTSCYSSSQDVLGYCCGTCQDALACSEDHYGCMFIDPNTGLCTSRTNHYFGRIVTSSGLGVIKSIKGSGKVYSDNSLPLINAGFVGWVNGLSNYKYMIRFDWDNCQMSAAAILSYDSIIADGIRYESDPNFNQIDGLSVWRANGDGTATCVYASGNYAKIENNGFEMYIGAVMNVNDLRNSQNGTHILNDSVMLGCLTEGESYCCTGLTPNRPLQTAVLCNSWFAAKY